MEIREKIARAACKAEGIDPGGEYTSIQMGENKPRHIMYNWQAKLPLVDSNLQVLAEWDFSDEDCIAVRKIIDSNGGCFLPSTGLCKEILQAIIQSIQQGE